LLQIMKEKFKKLSSRAMQNITGAVIGLTTALASVQRAGCNGTCRTCQACSAAGIMLILAPFILKFKGQTQKLVLGLSITALVGVGWWLYTIIL